MASDSEDKTQTRHEAAALVSQVSKLDKLETIIMTLWDQSLKSQYALSVLHKTSSLAFDVWGKRKRIADESDNDDKVAFTDGCLIFKVEPYYVIIDRLSLCLSKQIYTDVCEVFGVLFERVNAICMKKLWSWHLLNYNIIANYQKIYVG